MAELRRRINALGLLVFAAGIGLWELLVRSGALRFDYLPPPSTVLTSLAELLGSGELQVDVGHTLTATLTGWGLAALAGVAAGTVLGLLHPVWRYSMASLETLRALPIVAFVPVAVLLLGFSVRTEILVGFYAALWPIMLNTISGLRTEARLIEVGRVLRMSDSAVLWKVRLPSATAQIVVGLRLGLSTALVLTLVAEMVGNPAGLGFALVEEGQALQPGRMFAQVFVIGVLGILLNAALMSLARLLFRGQMATAGDLE